MENGDIINGKFIPTDENDVKLLLGSQMVNEIRNAVFTELGYTCSAGISHNRKFAKLVSSNNKPNGQTVLPLRGFQTVLQTVKFTKLQVFCSLLLFFCFFEFG